jgi:quercetin dioxygenase-like cupin family protein
MEQSKVEIIRWSGSDRPDVETIRKILAEEDLHGYRWSNGAGDVYSAHSHSYSKVIHVVSGSITFGLPDTNEKVTLHPGDRLNLPAGVSHNAVVGPEGVACIEAHR